jgi:hypothetical protein
LRPARQAIRLTSSPPATVSARRSNGSRVMTICKPSSPTLWHRSAGYNAPHLTLTFADPLETASDRARGGLAWRDGTMTNPIKWLLAGIITVVALMGAGSVIRDRREPLAPTEIFEGITYGCKRLDTTEEGNGLVYWARVDLAAPGVELYVTPSIPRLLRGVGSTACAELKTSLTTSASRLPSTRPYSRRTPVGGPACPAI